MKYLVALLFFILSTTSLSAQNALCDSDDICVVQFNASFNSANEVTWLDKLTDCNTNTLDIVADPNLPKDYKIVVVPTILVFDQGEEVARFQANIMMTL